MHTPSHPELAANASSPRLPVYYLSHGGGPWPYMSGQFRDMFLPLERSLQAIPRELPATPRALLVITAHWEESDFSVSSAAQPGMLYDYYGFPESLYGISYPAPGSPQVAQEVADLLRHAGWKVNLDPARPYDHGTYSLLQPMYPDANIPVVQLSLRANLDAAEHIAVGQALFRLRQRGILILGSGQSFHNLQIRGPSARKTSEVFDNWLRQTLLLLPVGLRRSTLKNWEDAPLARIAHPRAEHLIPLMVIVGAAGDDPGACIFGDYLADVATSAYRFGSATQDRRFDRLKLHETPTLHPDSILQQGIA